MGFYLANTRFTLNKERLVLTIEQFKHTKII